MLIKIIRQHKDLKTIDVTLLKETLKESLLFGGGIYQPKGGLPTKRRFTNSTMLIKIVGQYNERWCFLTWGTPRNFLFLNSLKTLLIKIVR